MNKNLIILLAALTALLGTLDARAATYTWTGAGFFGNKDYLWSNPNNWAELSAPQNGEQGVQLVFPNSGAPRQTTNDVLNLVIKSVIFHGANYGIHGAGGNGTTMNLRGDNGGEFAVATLATGCQFGSSTRLQLASAGTFTIGSGTTLTLKSRISGIYGFTKTGPGTLSLQGLQPNTFTGAVKVVNGVTDFRVVGTALPGALIVGDGASSVSPIARLYLDNQIGDSSAVTVNSNGTLELDGHDDLIGSLTLFGGATVTTIEGITAGTLTLNGNVTNHVGVAGAASKISGKLSLGSASRGFSVDDGSELEVAANISGVTAGLVKTGLGQLTLSGPGNTYSGNTTVQSGQLVLHEAKPGSLASGTIVGQGATLRLWDAHIGDELLSLNGTTNTPVVIFKGTNSWSGAVTLTGACQLKSDYQLGHDEEIKFGGNITGPGSLGIINPAHVHFLGFGNNTFGGGYFAESGVSHFAKSASAVAMSGPLVVGRPTDPFLGAHVILETANQIPIDSLITLRNSGVLSAEAPDSIGSVVFEGGWLMAMTAKVTLNGSVTNRTSPGNKAAIYGNVVLPAGEHFIHLDSPSILDVRAVLEGAGGLTINGGPGAVNLFNTNTYAGLTRVQAGVLYLNGAGRPGSSAAGTILEGAGALNLSGAGVTNETLTVSAPAGSYKYVNLGGINYWKGPIVLQGDVRFSPAGDAHLTVDGPISGPGGITFEGADSGPLDGVLEFAGGADNTYQGGTTLLEGALLLNKLGRAIPNSLTIGQETPGADPATVTCLRPGQFTPAADAAQMNDWRLTVNPAGSLRCNGFDQIVTGITTRGGSVYADGGTLSLQQGWRVEPNSGNSHFFGNLRLESLFNSFTHTLDVESNSSLHFWGDIGQAAFLAHVEKQGAGTLSMISSNSFNGNLTLSGGVTMVVGDHVYGTVNGHTRVDFDATLIAFGGTNAEPFILTGSGFQKQGALIVDGTNEFAGPVTLGYNTDIVTPDATDRVTFSGGITGPGGITKLGAGRLVLAGSTDNTYTGATKAREGSLELAKSNAIAIRGALDIAGPGGDGIVRYVKDHQLHDLVPVTVGTNGQFRLLGHTDLIGSLAGYGIVEMLAGSLLTGNDNTETTYAGVISGIGGNLTKTGTGLFTLAGDNVYTGTTFVKGGTLLVRGQQPLSDVTIQTGGTLGGNGRVGAVSDLSGHLRPGMNSYGVLKCAGFATHNPANQFQVEINGNVPGANQDQLDVLGGVTLMGGTLNVSMNFPGAVSNQYVIVKNEGNTPVTGTFTGLPQDALFVSGGVSFQIDYQGGDGNDIVLIQRSVAGVGPQLGGVKKLNDGTIQIGGSGLPNTIYSVEATEDLRDPIVWTQIGTSTADAQGQFTFIDPEAVNHPVRFYRFVLP